MARRKSVADGASGQLQDQALSDLETLINAVADARRDLRSYQSALELNHQHIVAGGRASEMSTLFDIPGIRTTFTERLTAIERARNAARLSLWQMASSEGANIADIARAWGLSRQLVSRALAGRPRGATESAHHE